MKKPSNDHEYSREAMLTVLARDISDPKTLYEAGELYDAVLASHKDAPAGEGLVASIVGSPVLVAHAGIGLQDELDRTRGELESLRAFVSSAVQSGK